MKYKAVIFDLDDTLFDRNAAQIKTVQIITEKLPHLFQQCSMENIKEAFLESDRLVTIEFDAGAPSEDLRDKRSRIFLQLLAIDEEYTDTITKIYLEEYPTINIPVAGAVSTVKTIADNVLTAIITNGLPDAQYKKIKAIGLESSFSCIVLSEEFGIRKPDKRIFLHAANLLKVQPSDCLYVGDNYASDIAGAKGAEMHACWINPSSLEPDNQNVKTDYIIKELAELSDILGL